MPPIEITFHTCSPSVTPPPSAKIISSHHHPIATNSRVRQHHPRHRSHHHALYFTITPASTDPASFPSPPPPTTAASTPFTTSTNTLSKRKKFNPFPVDLQSTKTASLTPLLHPIIARCLTQPSTTTSTPSTTPIPSPAGGDGTGAGADKLKKAKTRHMWPVSNPYSRSTDTKNDRSIVPSPRELAQMQKAEVDKIRASEESAAVARAAAAAKRKRAKSRGTSKSGTGVGTTSDSPTKVDPTVPTITTEPASEESTPIPSASALPLPPAPRAGLKRTRSTGLGISTTMANPLNSGGMAVSSPLRAVTGPSSGEDEEDVSRVRKKSRLSDSSTDVPPPRTRRATTHSPTTMSPALAPSVQVPHSEPIPHALLLPAQRRTSVGGDATAMRRAVSALMPASNGLAGAKKMTRTGSIGSADGIAARERAKREVTLPGRLRDYQMKPATVV